MFNPNRYNIHRILFPVAAGFALLSLLIFIALQSKSTVVPQSKPYEVLKIVLLAGTLPSTLLIFIFGLLTKLTKSRHPKELKRLAHGKAAGLLKEIAQSGAGGALTNPPGGVVRMAEVIAEIIKDSNHRIAHKWEDRLEELHEMVPAYQLPESHGEAEGTRVDWYKYDLCIIAARENVEFAKSIKKALRHLCPDRKWEIYVDDIGGAIGKEQEPFIKSVFYGGSRKCLALLSIHMISDKRNMLELNWAMQRAQWADSEANRNYLIPIALDRHGLDRMARDSYLKRYAENLNEIPETGRLFNEIVKVLLRRLGGCGDPSSQLPGDDDTETATKRFAVALSFPGEYRPFAKAVADGLKQRLPDREIFYDEYYTHELSKFGMAFDLQTIYSEQTELVVIFLCAEYKAKRWCGLEWRAAFDLVKEKRSDAIMLVRFDDTRITGLLSIDGYVDAKHRSPAEIVDLIMRRLTLIRQADNPRG